ALLCERRALLLSDLAAHAAGGVGVGARRRARHRAAALSPFRGPRGEASRGPCARARTAAHGGDGGALVGHVMRGLDPRIHHLRKKRFPKMMDCRVISAFTRVFRRAMPGNDEQNIGGSSVRAPKPPLRLAADLDGDD